MRLAKLLKLKVLRYKIMECRYPKSVKPIDDYKLDIIFDNNEKKLFDVKPYLSDPYFAPIKNPHIFETVKVNPFTV